MKDLVNSNVARQNVLNNKYALEEMQKAIGLRGVIFEGELKFTSQDLSSFFEVSDRTIRICLEKNQQELRKNGYDKIRYMYIDSGDGLDYIKEVVESSGLDKKWDDIVKDLILFDGKYYKIDFSIGHNGTVATVYNIGKIKEDVPPSAKIIAVVDSKALGKTPSTTNLAETSEYVNDKFF